MSNYNATIKQIGVSAMITILQSMRPLADKGAIAKRVRAAHPLDTVEDLYESISELYDLDGDERVFVAKGIADYISEEWAWASLILELSEGEAALVSALKVGESTSIRIGSASEQRITRKA